MAAHGQSAWIGIGSNLDDPVAHVRAAITDIGRSEATRVIRTSPLYRSAPLGPQDQPAFINAVVGVDTALAPRALLAALQAIERDHGRRPGVRWGPRTLDLDILVYADEVIDEAGLKIPHPGIPVRNFVLLPLFEIAPTLAIPGLGSIADVLARNDNTSPTIERLPDEP